MKKEKPKPDYEADKKLIQEGRKEIKKPKKKWTTKKVLEFLHKEELEKRGITFEQYEKERIEKLRENARKSQEEEEKEYREWLKLGFKGSRMYFSKLCYFYPETKEMIYKKLVEGKKGRKNTRIGKEAIIRVRDRLMRNNSPQV